MSTTTAYPNAKFVNVIGGNRVPIPEGMSAEQTVRVLMNQEITAFDVTTSEDGSVLTLKTTTGSKGIAPVRFLKSGKAVPYGNTSFPTDSDIEIIAELFPEDNLFETLENPLKLEAYHKAIKEHAELLKEQRASKVAKDRAKSVEKLVANLEKLVPYVLEEDNFVSDRVAVKVAEVSEFFKDILALAESVAVQTAVEEKAKEEAKAILATVRAEKEAAAKTLLAEAPKRVVAKPAAKKPAAKPATKKPATKKPAAKKPAAKK